MADLIERAMAISAINWHSNRSDCIEEVKRIPSVNRWIPAQNALPANKESVIFTVDRGHPFVCVGYRINSEREGLKLQRWFDKLSGLNFSDYDVKAWMPMPEAYKAPERGENNA